MGLAVTLPTGWVEVASSSRMRLGTVRLPRVEGDTEDGELSIIPAMGTVEANVDRWSGQFQEKPVPVLSTREVGEFEITFVELWGTFSPGMGAGGNSTPKPETLLLGAIVRMPGVSSLLFFKAWGPRKTMDQRKPEFEEFVSSLRPAR